MNKVSRERIENWITENLDEVKEALRGLVRIPSVSDAGSDVKPFGQPCRDVLEYMFALAKGHGFTSVNYDNYIGRVCFSEGKDSCGIWAHLDVVPVPDPSRWNYPPFDLTILEDEYMIGRGVNDNKMPAIGSYYALKCLLDLGFKPRKSWSLYMGTNEESGMADAKYFAAHYDSPDFSLVPDCGFPVCVGQRGSAIIRLSIPAGNVISASSCTDNPSVSPETASVTLEDKTVVTAKGTVTHAARCPEGENSILRALEKAGVAGEITRLCRKPDGSGLGIRAEGMAPVRMTAENGRLSFEVFIVLPVDCDADKELATAFDRCRAEGVEPEIIRLRRPVSFPADNPAVKLLTDVYNDVTGAESEPYIMSGGNYAAYIPRAVGYGPGMPGIEKPSRIFRPGTGDYHQCDESDTVSHLKNFILIYAMSIQAVDSADL